MHYACNSSNTISICKRIRPGSNLATRIKVGLEQFYYHDRRESGSERFFFCFFSYIAKSLLPEGKQRREQKHELSNRICRHRRPFGAMIDCPAFAMGSAAHRRTPSSGQRRDGERSDVRPCACCGRTRRAERRAAGAYERAAYSRSSGSCWCSSA